MEDVVNPTDSACIWVLYDLTDPEACETLHKQRAVWREFSDLAPFGPDHMVLLLFPGAALELS